MHKSQRRHLATSLFLDEVMATFGAANSPPVLCWAVAGDGSSVIRLFANGQARNHPYNPATPARSYPTAATISTEMILPASGVCGVVPGAVM
jgi:hypothetical protein